VATQSMIGALRVSLGLDSAAFMTRHAASHQRDGQYGPAMRNLGAGASAMGAAFVLAMRGQLKTADEAIKAAQTMGLSVEQYTRLGHAANLSGVSMGGLQTAIQRMAQAMVDTPALFEDLGIAVRDADGNLRGTDAVLLDFADAIAAVARWRRKDRPDARRAWAVWRRHDPDAEWRARRAGRNDGRG
jgi:hypothetical protein